jgi:YHYH protein
MPEGFITLRGGGSTKMTLVGWVADGFPIYARYGYSTASDASSALKVVKGSYQLTTTVSATRPSTTLIPLGSFAQDWVYGAGAGDLDECNGRTGVTPEFPNGIYHYYATDSYPYLQRCIKGKQ